MNVLPPPTSPRPSANGVSLLPFNLKVVPPSRFSPALVAEPLTVPAVKDLWAIFRPRWAAASVGAAASTDTSTALPISFRIRITSERGVDGRVIHRIRTFGLGRPRPGPRRLPLEGIRPQPRTGWRHFLPPPVPSARPFRAAS